MCGEFNMTRHIYACYWHDSGAIMLDFDIGYLDDSVATLMSV